MVINKSFTIKGWMVAGILIARNCPSMRSPGMFESCFRVFYPQRLQEGAALKGIGWFREYGKK